MQQQGFYRVKVYKLNETGGWDDKGTGLASVGPLEVRAGGGDRGVRARGRAKVICDRRDRRAAGAYVGLAPRDSCEQRWSLGLQRAAAGREGLGASVLTPLSSSLLHRCRCAAAAAPLCCAAQRRPTRRPPARPTAAWAWSCWLRTRTGRSWRTAYARTTTSTTGRVRQIARLVFARAIRAVVPAVPSPPLSPPGTRDR